MRSTVAAAFALGLLVAPARADAATTIAKGPYLQALGATGVTVKIELETPEIARLRVTGADGKAVTTDGIDKRTMHALRVDALAPGTTYKYVVTAGEAKAEGTFTTAPTDERPFKFLLYGDSRSGPETHSAIVKAMLATPGDFLINTGDMVYDGADPREWSELFSIERPLLSDRCVFVSVGNHELGRGGHDGEVAFLKYFASSQDGHERSKLYGSFRWASTRFFLLNAMDNWTGEERDWLKGELDKAMTEPGLKHRVAVLHWAPFSSGRHGNNPALAEGHVVEMMRERKVDLLLAGHDHVYERGDAHGIKYLISGGSGAPLYQKGVSVPETRKFQSVHHFVEVSVDGDHVGIVARSEAGTEIDRCAYDGDGAWGCDAPAMAATASPSAASADAPKNPPPKVAPATACGCSAPGVSDALDPRAIAAFVVALSLIAARARR